MSNSSGALTELAALGNQDAFLSINPEKTFWAQAYKRPTNFAVAHSTVTLDNAPSGTWRETRTVARIPRAGDMLGMCYFTCKLSALSLDSSIIGSGYDWGANTPANIAAARQETRLYWANGIGHVLIKSVEFVVGAQTVDKWTGDFLTVWESICGKAGKYLGEQIGQFDSEEDLRDFAAAERRLYVPLPFYFARAYALHKPLIALQYHETLLKLNIRSRDECIVRYRGGSVDLDRNNLIDLQYVTGGQMSDAAILCNFVFLDTLERRVFAQQPHEYLITQLQIHGEESISANSPNKQVQLHFNHPVISLHWFVRENTMASADEGWRYANFGVELGSFYDHQDSSTAVRPLVDPIDTVTLLLNGHERVSQTESLYFRTCVNWERNSRIPERYVYSYHFALYPEEASSPSGSLNMSRIDNVIMRLTFPSIGGTAGLANAATLYVFGVSHNVVKVAGGMFN